MRWIGLAPVAVAAVAIGSMGLAACSSGPGPAGDLSESDSGHAVLLSSVGQQDATLQIASGADAIMIGTARSNGPLVTATTPQHANVRPVIERGRLAIKVLLRHAAGTGAPAILRVYLNDSVRWRLVIGGGADHLVLNLTSARLRATEITAGFTTITMRLPHPADTSTVTLAGGASRVRVIVPPGVPSRLALNGGAGFATIAGRTHTRVAGGTVLTTPGWIKATRRYQIDAPAGVSSISVTPAGARPAAS